MASLGEVNLQEYLAKHSPDHPFARAQISFGARQKPSLKPSSQQPSSAADPMQPAADQLDKALRAKVSQGTDDQQTDTQ